MFLLSLLLPAQAQELVSPQWVAGETVEVVTSGGPPSSPVHLVASLAGGGSSCFPALGTCTDLARPVRSVAAARTDASGDATVLIDVPLGLAQQWVFVRAAYPNQPSYGSGVVSLGVCSDGVDDDLDGVCNDFDPCVGVGPSDVDGDGYCDDADCDPFDGMRHGFEVCGDGIDNDCDPATDDVYDCVP